MHVQVSVFKSTEGCTVKGHFLMWIPIYPLLRERTCSSLLLFLAFSPFSTFWMFCFLFVFSSTFPVCLKKKLFWRLYLLVLGVSLGALISHMAISPSEKDRDIWPIYLTFDSYKEQNTQNKNLVPWDSVMLPARTVILTLFVTFVLETGLSLEFKDLHWHFG